MFNRNGIRLAHSERMKTLKLVTLIAIFGMSINVSYAAHKAKLSFSSQIDKRSIDRLIKNILKEIQKKEGEAIELTLNLSSGGGEINETIRAVNFIRQMNINPLIEIHTKVSGWSSCESACTILYTAGKKRLAAERASFGFHSPKFQRGDRNGVSIAQIEDKYRKIWLQYVAMVDPAVATMLELNHYLQDEEMSYLSGRELHTGYVTDLL